VFFQFVFVDFSFLDSVLAAERARSTSLLPKMKKPVEEVVEPPALDSIEEMMRKKDEEEEKNEGMAFNYADFGVSGAFQTTTEEINVLPEELDVEDEKWEFALTEEDGFSSQVELFDSQISR
jgi:hypothetical protein